MPNALVFIISSFIFCQFLGRDLSPIPSASAAPVLIKGGQHCVAYKAKKRLFLVHTVDVVGKNCNISSQVIPQIDGRYYVEIIIPIKDFESQESERDRDVQKILKADTNPQMIFKSALHSKIEWQELFKKKNFALAGTLTIGLKPYSVVAQNQLESAQEGSEVHGVIKTQFKALSISPPSFAFGIAAQVASELEFHFNLLGQKTLGLEAILPSTKEL